jgi:hypothetical protein
MNPPPRPFFLRTSPRLLLVCLVLAGWMLCAVRPQVLSKLGIATFGTWYLDSYAVLAAVDAVRTGADPNLDNPLDPLLRSHKYSDWWYALRWLGLTREDNFALGCAWVGAFALAAVWSARPRNLRETAWLALLLVSPPALLAVLRANNDLVIFALLAVAGVAAAGRTRGRLIIALAALVLATGLKFYPAVAALAFLWIRPVRRVPWAIGLAVIAAGLTLTSVWPQLSRAQFELPVTLHTLGAPILLRDLGWTGPGAIGFGLGLITLAGLGLARGQFTVGLATEGDLPERLLAALGAIVLVACYTAGISYAYRWIFALWMALWMWRRAGDAAAGVRARWTLRLGCGLMLFCFWCDSLLCLVVNLFLLPLPQTRLASLLVEWRWVTQPLHWLLMLLLAGWLLEATMATWAEWRKETGPAPSR